jgi:hypothetical protein
MTNIVKKIKNVNPLAMFAKLVALAVVFNLTSCGCTKNQQDNLVATFETTKFKTNVPIPVKVEAKHGDVPKLSEYTIKIDKLTAKDSTGTTLTDKQLKDIAVDQDGEDLATLTKTQELKKTENRPFNLVVSGAPENTTVEFTVSIMKGNKAIASADNVSISWTNMKTSSFTSEV